MIQLQISYPMHIEWLSTGRFFLWSEKDEDWKKLIFGWHEASFYGTSLGYEIHEGKRGVFLDPWLAIDYFQHPKPLLHGEIKWLQPGVLVAAKVLKEVLVKGWFMPDPRRWTSPLGAWRIKVPQQEQNRIEQRLQKAQRSQFVHAEAWLDAAIRHVLARDPATKTLFQQLLHQYPILQQDGEQQRIPEPIWLEESGFIHSPFRVGIQLQEPNDESDPWSFQFVLQSQDKPEHHVVVKPDGTLLVGFLPKEWETVLLSKLQRVSQFWISVMPELEEHDQPGFIRDQLDEAFVWYFLIEGSVKLAQAGITVFLPEWWDITRRKRPLLKAKLTSSVGAMGQGYFGMAELIQFDWSIAVGDTELPPEQLHSWLSAERRMVKLGDEWVVLDPHYLRKLEQTIQRYRHKGLTLREVLELHLTDEQPLIDDVMPPTMVETDEQEEMTVAPAPFQIELNEAMAKWLERLQQVDTIPEITPSSNLGTKLRQYQLKGASWMAFLGEFGLGACLADDMGLGKTVQWIAYLLHIRETHKINDPALLICPTSVLGNWQKELERFAPTLQVYVHHGPSRVKQEAFQSAVKGHDLVLTTYPLVHSDGEELQSIAWSTICLDEAQAIKNAHTKQSAAIRKLRAPQRFALTGTPIVNRLTELWSIFDFLNPGYLGSLSAFKKQYVGPIEKGHTDKLAQLQKLIHPFLLRRSKLDPSIELDLPEKREMKMYVHLTKEQGLLYEQFVHDLLTQLDQLGIMERRALIFTTLTRLKQVCNHPALLSKDNFDESMIRPEQSVKSLRLLEMVREIREKGEQCLIFTQFVQMGRLLQHWIQQELAEPVDFLNGSVPKQERDRMIARFQGEVEGEKRGVFILSLKAGGTGLNLTAANHVIHFDRWWNPAVENQATDRAFRIGQRRDVQVYKMIALGTLEERIDELIERKLEVSEQVLSRGEAWISELSARELRDIFELRKQWLER